VRHLPEAAPALLCTTTSPGELALLESLLAGMQLPYSVVGTGVMQEYVPMRILVRQDDLPRARELLASLKDPTEVAPADAPPDIASVRTLVAPASPEAATGDPAPE
jgi:hypothetical protein